MDKNVGYKNKRENRYPVYIVSKGRYTNMLTNRALNRLGVPFRVIVEEQEFDEYAKVVGGENLLILPKKYKEEYELMDDLGLTKSTGPGPARNFAWDHSLSEGHTWHWVLDDNIDDFHRLHRNTKCFFRTNVNFVATEDFIDRYENVAIAGFNYSCFCKQDSKANPYVLNTRIYSCLLIRNDIPFRWRGRYNEDTILCLDVLSSGWATIQLNAFLQDKVTTQRMSGGNSKDFYSVEGTLAKSKMLADAYPDVASVVWKFNRWHHQVDYSSFKNNPLKRKASFIPQNKVNEYGLKLIDGVKNDK
jgi:hypothetical protein